MVAPFTTDGTNIYALIHNEYAATRALLAYPELYKVEVASSPDQDLSCYLGHWAEKYQGLPPDERYARQPNAGLVESCAASCC